MTDKQDNQTDKPIKFAPPPDDFVKPFRVETLELRGQLVRLGDVVDTIVNRHDYPYPVAVMLAEAITLTACLANSLKYKGTFTLQAQSDGPVAMLVCDVTDTGHLRGYAEFNEDKLAALLKELGKTEETQSRVPVPRLMGEGHLAFTMDSELNRNRYQGIVELTGETLTDCVHHYFHQSEQIETVIKVAVAHVGGEQEQKRWRSCALMLQRLPVEERKQGKSKREIEELDENWRRALIFMGSSTDEEMLSETLSANSLIYRLFNEDGVRVYDPLSLDDECRCNNDKVEMILQSMSDEAVEEMKIDGEITVTCQFCKKKRVFDEKALKDLRKES